MAVEFKKKIIRIPIYLKKRRSNKYGIFKIRKGIRILFIFNWLFWRRNLLEKIKRKENLGKKLPDASLVDLHRVELMRKPWCKLEAFLSFVKGLEIWWRIKSKTREVAERKIKIEKDRRREWKNKR